MALEFLDLSEACEPLSSADWSIIQSVIKPSSLPLPGCEGVWETPRLRSPDCEFGDATAILKTLKLNPNAAVFEIPAAAAEKTSAVSMPPASGQTTAVSEVLATPVEKPTKKLSATSTPFVPNIPIPLPTSHAQTIHITNLTANLNYHVLSSDNQTGGVRMPSVSGSEDKPVGPIPFTVNGSFPDYIHPFQNKGYRADGYQSPVLVYQDPNINHVFYPAMGSKEKQLPPSNVAKKPEIVFGSGSPAVSVSGSAKETEGYNGDTQPYLERRKSNPSHAPHPQGMSMPTLHYGMLPPAHVAMPHLVAPEAGKLQQGGVVQPQHTVVVPPHSVALPQHAVVVPQHAIVASPHVMAQLGTVVSQQHVTSTPQRASIVPPQVTRAVAHQMISPQNVLTPQPAVKMPVEQEMQPPVVRQQLPDQGHKSNTENQVHPNYAEMAHQHAVSYDEKSQNIHRIQAEKSQVLPQSYAEKSQIVQQNHTEKSQSVQQNHSEKLQKPVHQINTEKPQSAHLNYPEKLQKPVHQVSADKSQTWAEKSSSEPQKTLPTKAPQTETERNQSPATRTPDMSEPEHSRVQAENLTETVDNNLKPVVPSPVPQADPVEAEEAGKSWASLFKSQASAPVTASVKPTARISPFHAMEAATPGPTKATALKPSDASESKSREIGRFLLSYKLSHYAPAIMPCGLSNRSNWCFVNAILQALLACPPFYNLFKQIPWEKGLQSSPMTGSLVEFVQGFHPLETIVKMTKKEKNRKKEEIRTGVCLEPGGVYKMLLNLSEDTFKVIEGRQEDAEEFLTCLLNGVSDEMTELIKLVPKEDGKETEDVPPAEEEEEGGEDDWQEVDSRGKGTLTRRVVAPASAPVTPIQGMALGMCRSSLRSATGELSATLQPFFTLQLDIQGADISSINQALLSNFDSEDIDGYICQKTKQVVGATRSLSLEELPPILILHMKRFVYDGNTGGVQKVMKPVGFTVDLEIPKGVLSNEVRPKFNNKQRQYKLFAVVYHNGREATKGHYVADVYHTGYSTWLHCDDSTLTETAEQSVLSPSENSTPYILFYRRCDTMVGIEKSKEKK